MKMSNKWKDIKHKKDMNMGSEVDSIERTEMAGQIWKTLSPINVSEHTEKKGPMKLTYLSWTWAYATMMEHYPNFKYIFSDNEVHPDGTVTVHCHGFIGDVAHEMWLPVMDPKSKFGGAKMAPTARDISDTKMRCLVKCIAMFGLGLYIFAGEDLPSDVTDAKPASDGKAKPVKVVSEDEKAAFAAVALTLNTFIEDVTDRDELKKYWKDNKQALINLQGGDEELYSEVLKNFKAQGKLMREKEGEA
jgi:hypothetical protein